VWYLLFRGTCYWCVPYTSRGWCECYVF